MQSVDQRGKSFLQESAANRAALLPSETLTIGCSISHRRRRAHSKGKARVARGPFEGARSGNTSRAFARVSQAQKIGGQLLPARTVLLLLCGLELAPLQEHLRGTAAWLTEGLARQIHLLLDLVVHHGAVANDEEVGRVAIIAAHGVGVLTDPLHLPFCVRARTLHRLRLWKEVSNVTLRRLPITRRSRLPFHDALREALAREFGLVRRRVLQARIEVKLHLHVGIFPAVEVGQHRQHCLGLERRVGRVLDLPTAELLHVREGLLNHVDDFADFATERIRT
mmetsp:Transcript_17770/g.40709  ORF Transcript_17770/g.40709 Transcript_17770/m.40709 type:complete len:281 (-) Transcript_17770:1170-2012(-)